MKCRSTAEIGLTVIAPCIALIVCACSGQERAWDCLLADSIPEANANPLHGVIFHTDRFVAVGDSGTVMMSTNATRWFRQPTPTQSALYGVAADQGQFVAVGDAGCVLLSTNGSDWNLATQIPGKNLRAVAYGNGVYVVLTDQSQLLVSSDALTWQPGTNGLPQYAFPVGLYFGGNRFIAHGLNGLILSSADGLNWTAVQLGATTFAVGAYGGGTFVVAGHEDFFNQQVAYSSDGVSWTPSILGPNGLWAGLCHGAGSFVGVDDNQVICSTDGRSWGPCGGNFPIARLKAYGLGQYVALGENALIYTSTNLYDWVVRSAPVCPMNSVAYGNGLYVGTVGTSVYTSVDGVHFVETQGPVAGYLTSVTFANGLFVAGASNPSSGDNWIVVSSDGTNWTTFIAPCTSYLRTVKYGNGVWVALCGSIISSVDATNWAVRVPNPGDLEVLAYGANRWVSCGFTGLIWSSPDGIHWQNCNYAGAGEVTLGPIVIQDGLFSIFQVTGYLIPENAYVSNDGVHWTDAAKYGPLLAIHQEVLPDALVLSLAGKWDAIYRFQRSLNLKSWSNLRDITNTGGVTSVPIANPATESSVFFRAIQR